ncbi:hypothetical protein [Brevundimonas naejangsanensis]|uniref:hypothetical protein n=1 Tax=Brevundimonas naejangsanensis TaxID=588932 RepID=UPI0013C4B073|nr:hypothetical protein [Brevundimonas naejangsanensis]
MKRWLVIFGALTLLVLGLVTWVRFGPLDERTAIVFRDSHGSIVAGEKFGVRIGDSWQEANRELRQHPGITPGFHYAGWSEVGPKTIDEGILVGETMTTYRDTSWRNGVILLKLRDGKVAGIQWNYVGPLYIDT